MSLTQRLKNRSAPSGISPLSTEKVLESLIVRTLKADSEARLSILEQIFKREIEKMIQEARDTLVSLKQEMKQAILNHIQATVEIKGDKGNDGYSPIKGKDYFDGFTPKKGVDYFDGKTPTREELLSIIQPLIPNPLRGEDGKTLAEKEMLELFKPLVDKALKDFAIRIPKQGGGMGNVIHEQKAVSASTTTVSTANKIAGAGFALWVYYNGQFIARGVDYTVGGDYKTLTLTFTPQNSTIIDIIYHR